MTNASSPDELDYAAFTRDPATLDEFLVQYSGPAGMRFLTYAKLADLQDIWARYHFVLEREFDFRILPDDAIVDVGAHHGIVALNYARLGASVYAFEPNPINYAVLKRNLALNPTYRISAAQQALAAQCGNVSFNFGKTSTTGALAIAERDWKRTDQSLLVEAVTLESIMHRHGLDAIKLLKVDCEGEEYDLFFNTPVSIIHSAAYMCVEVHPTKRYEPPVLEDFLASIGYEVMSKPAAHGCIELYCKYRGDE